MRSADEIRNSGGGLGRLRQGCGDSWGYAEFVNLHSSCQSSTQRLFPVTVRVTNLTQYVVI